MVSTSELKVCALPPLILHPFSDASGSHKLVESSRAGLMLQGLLPRGEFSSEELELRLMEGRYAELRMLFYIGRDLSRWIEQSCDFLERKPDLASRDINGQSFAHLLVNSTPQAVVEKLRKWGVVDHRSIFARALGLNVVFLELPLLTDLNRHFLRSYFHYAESIFALRQQLTPFREITTDEFTFEIFASGEYSRMLERSWKEA